jgi:hypothetical protein
MAIDLTIKVLYSCHECGLNRVSVDVPARGEEHVVEWMESTGKHLSNDHANRSPECHPETLSDVMIPITGTDRVGGATIN